MNKHRTFLSLNINNTLKEKVSNIQDELKKILTGYNIKWEDPEKFHMTLRFLGDIEETEVEKLSNELSELKFSFYKLLFFSHSIDFFPNERKPNVIFLGLLEDGNNSDILTIEIDKIILKYGIKPDKKFVPHITLGRFRRENRKSVQGKNFPEVERFDFDFDGFYFMKSMLDFKGSKFFIINKYLFKNTGV